MPVVATNTAANSAIRFLNNNSAAAANSVSKLSSGSRIVRASDDAAGLAISTKLTSDSTVLKQAATNASQAASVLQVGDGALARIADVLQRLKALAAQSSSGVISDTERGYINAEYQALNTEVGDIITSTTFNNQQIVNTFSQSFLVGVSTSHTIAINLNTLTAVAGPGGTVSTTAGATAAIGAVDGAIQNLSTQRATLGAYISRFETRGQAIATSIENIDAANSAIKDVDLAAEQSKLVSNNVLVQAAVSALSQANQIPQQLLRVLQ
ncbi:flagellin [Kiloniella laminariae]|uniref:Flagellin n=1 Tax=Kiloniella laminariae TaxID=454162 RepID=A0ABT4LHE9_9PROT|nr:flagellin [Kiloniella laminariae]MCZ4280514.1 flagellin [Kiloniella laminariae]